MCRGDAFRLRRPVGFRVVVLLSIPSPGDPFIINSGPIHARWYGLLLALGVLLAGWLARREFRRRAMDPELAYSIAVWGVPFGLAGARLYHVVTAGMPSATTTPRSRRSGTAASHLRRGAGRHAGRLDRLPAGEAAVLAGGGLHRPRAGAGTGAGPLGQPSTRSCTASPQTGPGAWRSLPLTARRHIRTRPPSSRCSCSSRYSTCWCS